MKKILLSLSIFLMSWMLLLQISNADNKEYVDEEAGVSFEIPEGWNEVNFNTDKEYLEFKMQPEGNSVVSIMYGSAYIKDSVTKEDIIEYNLTDKICSDGMSEDQFAELVGVNRESIGKVDVNGVTYFLFMEIIDESYDYAITGVYRIDNGYLYMFELLDVIDGDYYDDFIDVIWSVNYTSSNKQDKVVEQNNVEKQEKVADKNIEATNKSNETTNTNKNEKSEEASIASSGSNSDQLYKNLFWGLLIIVFIVICFVVISKTKILDKFRANATGKNTNKIRIICFITIAVLIIVIIILSIVAGKLDKKILDSKFNKEQIETENNKLSSDIDILNESVSTLENQLEKKEAELKKMKE